MLVADVRHRRRSAPAAARSPASTTAARFRVGPRSAGADPGPACYGRGGTEPTVTDAHLVLGRIDPERFLGGGMPLDRDAAAARAIDGARRAARPAAPRPPRGSLRDRERQHGADDPRRSPSSAGHDPREFALVAFGGAGPAARGRARRASSASREVVIPPHPGITSAAGPADDRPALRPDAHGLRWSRARSTASALDARLRRAARRRCVERLARDGADRADVRDRALAGLPLRRPGLRAAHPGRRGRAADEVARRFHARPPRTSTATRPGDPIEIVNLRVTRPGRRPQLERIAVEPATGVRDDRRRPGAIWRVDGASPSCRRRACEREACRRRAGRRRRRSCSSATRRSPCRRAGRPRRRRAAALLSSPTPEGAPMSADARRRPDHRRRHRRRAELDRDRHGLPPGAHVLLLDHPRVRGLRLRDLRPRGPPALRVDPVDAAAVRRRSRATSPASTGASPRCGDDVAARRRRHPQPPVLRRLAPARRRVRRARVPRGRARRLLRRRPRTTSTSARSRRAVRDRRRDRRLRRGPAAQRGQGRGGGAAASRAPGGSSPTTRASPPRRRRPRGAGRGREARGRALLELSRRYGLETRQRRVRAADGPLRADAAPRRSSAAGRPYEAEGSLDGFLDHPDPAYHDLADQGRRDGQRHATCTSTWRAPRRRSTCRSTCRSSARSTRRCT